MYIVRHWGLFAGLVSQARRVVTIAADGRLRP